jgi:hypothetical protein
MIAITERLDDVIAATTALREVRTQLQLLEEQRINLEEAAQRLLQVVAGVASNALSVPVPRSASRTSSSGSGPTLTDRVVAFARSNAGNTFSAADLTGEVRGDASADTVRGTLSRLAAEGRIVKVAYGRYTARSENENAPLETE